MSRAKLTGSSVSFGVLRATPVNGAGHRPEGGPELVEERVAEMADVLRPTLRDQDLLSRVDPRTIAVVLPGTPLERAEGLLTDWQEVLAVARGAAGNGGRPTISVWAGACEYRNGGFIGDKRTERFARRISATPPTPVVAIPEPSPPAPTTADDVAEEERPEGNVVRHEWRRAENRKGAWKGKPRGRRRT
jgi:hypothetical protein